MTPRHKIHQQIELVYIIFSLQWNVEIILQSRTLSWCSQSSTNYSEKEPALQCRRQYACAGLVVIEAWFRGY